MQKLTAVESEFDTIEDGKRCTIRLGRRDIKLGPLEFESLEQKRRITVKITHVLYCLVQDIPREYVLSDGFIDRHDLIHQMETYYPDIDEVTEVTIVVFNSR